MQKPHRIKQAVAKIVLTTGNYFWVRISRQRIGNLIHYWRNYPNFRYAKFYDIVNYQKGTNHTIGRQLGFITLNGYNFY